MIYSPALASKAPTSGRAAWQWWCYSRVPGTCAASQSGDAGTAAAAGYAAAAAAHTAANKSAATHTGRQYLHYWLLAFI